MTVKIVGATLVILGSAAVGFALAAAYRKEERALQQLVLILEYMQSELQYRMPPLPELCRMAAAQAFGPVGAVFGKLALELDKQVSPDACSCMYAAMAQVPKLSESVKRNLHLVGLTLGRFHLSGQLSGLQAAAQLCQRDLDGLYAHREERMRSYKTLGICAGVALVILFI